MAKTLKFSFEQRNTSGDLHPCIKNPTGQGRRLRLRTSVSIMWFLMLCFYEFCYCVYVWFFCCCCCFLCVLLKIICLFLLPVCFLKRGLELNGWEGREDLERDGEVKCWSEYVWIFKKNSKLFIWFNTSQRCPILKAYNLFYQLPNLGKTLWHEPIYRDQVQLFLVQLSLWTNHFLALLGSSYAHL